MFHRHIGSVVFATLALAACDEAASPSPSPRGVFAATFDASDDDSEGARFGRFLPLETSASCTVAGGDPVNPLSLPPGYTQRVIASEPDFVTNGDMLALNLTGPQRGRYLYRTHEMGPNAGISITDLKTSASRMLVRRQDWVALDGLIWTPWGTLLFAEELQSSASNPDPDFPGAKAGLVYEMNPRTLSVAVRPALGSRSHEGQAIDEEGNYYGISERNGGAIFKFVPTRRGDFSSGALYALKVTTDLGDRTGPASWIRLDGAASMIDADAEALAKGATGYGRPEDIERWVSPNKKREVLFVALTSEDRVIAIDISTDAPSVTTLVKNGINAPADFKAPDNLALDAQGYLYIAEDPGGNYPTKKFGDDVWVASFGEVPTGALAQPVRRFASINDCDAEPTGILFSRNGKSLYLNVQHRGGDGLDKTVVVRRRVEDEDN